MLQQIKRVFVVAALAAGFGLAALSATAQASLLHSYQMDNPTPLADSGASPDALTSPVGSAAPTFLPAGGRNGSGAYQFDGVNDHLGLTTSIQLGNQTADWTASFLINTTDTAVNAGHNGGPGYDATPEVPVLGDTTGGINFGIGIDGGKATVFLFKSTGFAEVQDTVNIADGTPHYVTVVHHGAATGTGAIDIYVDSTEDVTGVVQDAIHSVSAATIHDIGLSYNGHYGALTLDDVNIFNTALTSSDVATLIYIPEPASMSLLAVGGLMLIRRNKRSVR